MAFWHTLSRTSQVRLKRHGGLTVGEFVKRYRQPNWCDYPDALEGSMGCWALFYGDVHRRRDCAGCGLRQPKVRRGRMTDDEWMELTHDEKTA